MAREFVTAVRFAQVSTLPSAASSTGHVLEQGGKLWYSDGATWFDLGATGGGSSGYTRITGATTAVAGTPYLAVFATAADVTLPAFTAGQWFHVMNSADSAANARVVVGGSNVINNTNFATGDNVTLQPGEAVTLIAESTTELDLHAPGAVGPAGASAAGGSVAVPFTDGDTARRVTVSNPSVTATSKIVVTVRRADTADDSADRGYVVVPTIVRQTNGAFDVLLAVLDLSGEDPTANPPNETMTLNYTVS